MWQEQKQQADGSNSLREIEYLWDIVELRPRKALSKTYQAYHKRLSQKKMNRAVLTFIFTGFWMNDNFTYTWLKTSVWHRK